MYDVGLLERKHLGQAVGECRYMGPQIVLEHRRCGAGRDVNHLVTRRCREALGQVWIVATGVGGDRVPEANKTSGELRDVYVLAPGVDATNGGQRTRMFRDEGDAHSSHHSFSALVVSRYPALLPLNGRSVRPAARHLLVCKKIVRVSPLSSTVDRARCCDRRRTRSQTFREGGAHD
jgi:hypothetical protein